MNNNIRKFWPKALFALATGTSLVYGSEESRIRNLENRITSLECSQNACCIINPSARPFASECWGIYVTIDPIIWQAHVNGLGSGIFTDGSTNFFNNAGKSEVQNLNYNWDWGFRLGVGLNTAHDAWDLRLAWTYWNTDATKNTTADANNAIFPRIGHPNTLANQSARTLDEKWDLHYNILDLENGREFYVSKFLTLRPFAGLRSAWIDQDWKVTYGGLSPSNTSLEVCQDDRFWGLGILGGIEMQWNFICGWSVFSNFSGSLLYAFHSVKHDEKIDSNDSFKVSDFYHVGTSIFDSQIGIRWDWVSCNECYHIGLDLGWENHWLPGQNQFLVFVENGVEGKFVANQGDLGIQGFFFRARADF